jgi:hypothetical protein
MRRPGHALVFLLLALAAPLGAQVPEYQLKAEFLERFTRFIEWPAESRVADPAAPFVIAIIGRNPFGAFLDTLATGRRIKGKPVVVRQLAGPEQAADCDLLFIAGGEHARLKEILSRTAGRPILTVGDGDEYARSGVLFNFSDTGDQVAFEISEPAVKKSGLSVSSRLLRLARRVDGEGT